MAAAIEYHRSRAWPETKNIARVMRFCSVQYECIGIPFFRRDVKAVHFRLSSQQSRGIRCPYPCHRDRSTRFGIKAGLAKEILGAFKKTAMQRTILFAANGGKFLKFFALLRVQPRRHFYDDPRQ